jgi:uncharacterized MAPEG superfamily protein
MDTLFYYLLLSGVLTLLLWVPYIVARVFVWGLPAFIHNYPKGYPASQPEPPMWAQRAHRAHINMVETMPAFIAVVIAASQLASEVELDSLGLWAAVFFFARVAYSMIYIVGVPFLRTPSYLVSWFAILAMAFPLL